LKFDVIMNVHPENWVGGGLDLGKLEGGLRRLGLDRVCHSSCGGRG
jgi:hypothetical protein